MKKPDYDRYKKGMERFGPQDEAVICMRVGAAKFIAPMSSTSLCECCTAQVWVSPSTYARISEMESGAKAHFLCTACAARVIDKGMGVVPPTQAQAREIINAVKAPSDGKS